MLVSNPSNELAEKLPRARTPVFPSSSMKNCDTSLLPTTGLGGVRPGGKIISSWGAVSSKTFRACILLS